MRPLLSQDSHTLDSLIVDKTSSGGNSSKTTRILGPVTLVHCSTNITRDTQESTRALVLTPDVTQNKLKAGIRMAL